MKFIQTCPVQPKYESYKIWAAWIIEQRSLYNQIDFFLPYSVKQEQQERLIQLLSEKDCSQEQAVSFVQHISSEASKLIKAHLYLKLFYRAPERIEPFLFHHKNSVSICYQSIKHTLRQNQFYKLSTFYEGPLEDLNWNIWIMMNNYYLLDGHSYQWALSNRILKVLRLYLKVKAELFASPLNAHYPEYYSLFSEDRLFGSRGNFFKADPSDFEEGVYQVNPPFLDNIFIKTVERLLSFLSSAEQAGKGLMFIFVMPNWLDSTAYRSARDSVFCQQEVVLDAEDHYYYSYKEYKYIKVQFSTHILVLGNKVSRGWCSSNIMSNIVSLFRNPFV